MGLEVHASVWCHVTRCQSIAVKTDDAMGATVLVFLVFL